MFFGNLRIRFLKISWLDIEQYGKTLASAILLFCPG